MKPVLLDIGPFHLYGYGAMVVLGGVLSFWFLSRRSTEAGLRTDEDFWILVNVILASGFLGGRVLYLFEYTKLFSAEFWRTFASASSAFSILGAFIAVPLAIAAYCCWRRVPFLRLFDVVCVMAPMWHAVGRIGCLLAGCCYGRPTPGWGLVFRDPRTMVPPEWRGVPLYPTQLSEAAGNLVLAGGLFVLLNRTRAQRPGLVAVVYLAAYGVFRFVLEYFRGDAVEIGRGLTAGQCLSAGLIGVAGGLWLGRSRFIPRS